MVYPEKANKTSLRQIVLSKDLIRLLKKFKSIHIVFLELFLSQNLYKFYMHTKTGSNIYHH